MSYDLGIGVLLFNPHDDKVHFRQIELCLLSIIAAIHRTDKRVKFLVLMNLSVVGNPELTGVGQRTQSKVKNILENSNISYHLFADQFPNSMNVAAYHRLQRELHEKERSNKVVVFADDYIIPSNWIDTIFHEFHRHPHATFLTPASVFIPQVDLLVPLKLQPSWQLVRQQGRIVGIAEGVSIKDVNDMAMLHQHRKAIEHHRSANSFETTVFTRDFLSHCGYVYPHYFSTWYNNEYFKKAKKQGERGIVSYQSFVFHHGKGGTAALHKETRDEKYKGSPYEKYLAHDVTLYNKRNNANIPNYWWREEPIKERNIAFSELNKKIEERLRKNYYRSIERKTKSFLRMRIKKLISLLYYFKNKRTKNI